MAEAAHAVVGAESEDQAAHKGQVVAPDHAQGQQIHAVPGQDEAAQNQKIVAGHQPDTALERDAEDLIERGLPVDWHLRQGIVEQIRNQR